MAHPASPVNGATLKRITYSVPEGTVINATYPAALGARALVAMYLQGLIFRTLAQAVPDRVIAETGTPPHLSAYMGLGNGGRRYVDIMFLNGGLGARPTMDGVSSIGWPANIAGIPVEVTENEKPLLFLAKELVTDSGGAGRQRGGLAAHLEVRSEARQPITVGVRLDRISHPALGLFGGKPGGTAAVYRQWQARSPQEDAHSRDGRRLCRPLRRRRRLWRSARATAGGCPARRQRRLRVSCVLRATTTGWHSTVSGDGVDPLATQRLRKQR